VKVDLPPVFIARIDQAAHRLGLTQGDDYLAQLRWSEPAAGAGTPSEVAAAVRRELEAGTRP
jgi:hypothetical protein